MNNLKIVMTLAPRKISTVNECIQCLREEGIDNTIHLICEPGEYTIFDKNVTIEIHKHKKGTFVNYDYVLNKYKDIDEYLWILQDDYLLQPGGKKLIEYILTQKDFGYYCMHLSDANKDAVTRGGWVDTRLGRAAIGACYIYEPGVIKKILKHEDYIHHLNYYVTNIRNQAVDACISKVLDKMDLPTFYHKPSPTLHIGHSTMGHQWLWDSLEKIQNPITQKDETFNYKKYREDRYQEGGHSGAGSYGDNAKFKAAIINKFCKDKGIKSAIEVGCGDGANLGLYDIPEYLGVDVSQKSIDICKKTYKDKRFKAYRQGMIDRAELTLCLDVTYHIFPREERENTINKVIDMADRYAIFYSFPCPNENVAHINDYNFEDYLKTYCFSQGYYVEKLSDEPPASKSRFYIVYKQRDWVEDVKKLSKNFVKDFDYMIRRVFINKKPTAFPRYNEGEYGLISQKGFNGAGGFRHTYEDKKKLAKDTIKCLKRDEDGYIFGIATQQHKEANLYYHKNIESKRKTFSTVFVNANWIRFNNIIKHIQEDVVVVGNEEWVNSDRKLPFYCKEYHNIPFDVVSYYEDNKKRVYDMCELISKNNNTLVLFCAGPLSNIMIDICWDMNKTNRYIDIGSTLDEYIMGRPTRRYFNKDLNTCKQIDFL